MMEMLRIWARSLRGRFSRGSAWAAYVGVDAMLQAERQRAASVQRHREALVRERAELEADRDAWQRMCVDARKERDREEEEKLDLRAERDRLIEQIAVMVGPNSETQQVRAALAETTRERNEWRQKFEASEAQWRDHDCDGEGDMP